MVNWFTISETVFLVFSLANALFSLGYRPFMMVLQQQVNLLDKFVIKQESIPNFVPPTASPSQIIASDNVEQYSKNVSKISKL